MVQRHESDWVNTPPSGSPNAPPLPAIAPQIANARARSPASVNVVESSDSAAGASSAASTRWRPSSPDAPTPFYTVLRAIADAQAGFHGLGEWLRDGTGDASPLEPLTQRLGRLLDGVLREALASGTVRADLTLEDVFLVVAMVEGALSKQAERAHNAAAARRALELALGGLLPRDEPVA